MSKIPRPSALPSPSKIIPQIKKIEFASARPNSAVNDW